MKQSQLFGKTNKSAKEFDSTNATLLIKAGFIDQVMAGGYSYLTLGLRTLTKIENIIREEMNKISAEVLMPCLTPVQLWETTGRLNTVDVLMKTTPANALAKEKNDTEYALGFTHEEVITPLAKTFYMSYKDFPLSVYQINTKFRNESRAKSGLLRCREFRMKDMYSFHRSEDELKEYYKVAAEAYWKVFERLGLKEDTYYAMASGGDFTDDYSHEFQTRIEAGEDLLFHVKSKNLTFNREVAPSQAPKLDSSQEMLEMKEFNSPAVGVATLAKEIGIRTEDTTKTMLYEDDQDQLYAVAVRGGYDIDEMKLKKITGAKTLTFAGPEGIKKAETVIGFVGAMNMPSHVKVIWDESTRGRKNFEIGANKANVHLYNVNWGRDLQEPEQFYDVKVAREGDIYPETDEVYEVFKAAEVGNIFPLYTKFSDAFDYHYVDEKGQEQPIYMGCYGIGSSRIMGVIVEKFHDEKGIVWPEAVAPFQVHLIGLNLDDEAIKTRAEEIYKTLTDKGIEVLFDDRNKGPGEKFADADLIGIPHRLVVSRKTGEQVEYKKRNSQEARLLSLEDFLQQNEL